MIPSKTKFQVFPLLYRFAVFVAEGLGFHVSNVLSHLFTCIVLFVRNIHD